MKIRWGVAEVVMHENDIATAVLNSCRRLRRVFGLGLLAEAYRRALVVDLRAKGLAVQEEVPVPMVFRRHRIPVVYRAHCVVESKVVVELKSVERLSPVHQQRVLTYLRLSHLKLGLLVNFGTGLAKGRVERIVNGQGSEELSFEKWLDHGKQAAKDPLPGRVAAQRRRRWQ